MAFSVRIMILLIGLFIFLFILELVRRKKFREELSLIWIIIGIGLIFGSFADRIIDPVASKIGIHYPPVLVFLLIFFLLIITTLYFSFVLSDLKSKIKEMAQKMALMEYKIENFNKKKVE